MLQILIATFIFLFSQVSFAQDEDQANIPDFLKKEAEQSQYGTQPASFQNQPVSEVPAFMMNEQDRLQYEQQQQYMQQQNQYNYQSANPDSGVFTLPPATYQPAPGDVPAFIQQEQNGAPAQQEQDSVDIKSNDKDDVIQINFSEDQYKPEEEVTTLDKEQAVKYNTEVQKETQATGEPTEELPEGAKFEDKNNEKNATATDVEQKKVDDNSKAVTQAVPEPEKAGTNILRISYSKEGIELNEKDKANLLSVVRLLKNNKQNKVAIRAFTSERELGADPRKVSLMRIIAVREFLMKQGVSFSQTEVKVIEPELNKEDLDYIDIDKI